MPLLTVRGLSHRYRQQVALDNVEFSLKSGITGLLGENGAGKTTLLRVCSGGLVPLSGEVMVNDVSLLNRAMRSSAVQQIALMPQTSRAPARLTALEFVSYVTWMRGHSWPKSEERARDALNQVNLDSVRGQRMTSMSGGMQRRVWLAQALAAKPQVLLLDEPSTGLDPRQRAAMVTALDKIATQGTAILMSSHIIEDVAALASDLLVLSHGALIHQGQTPAGLSEEWFLGLTEARP